MESPIGVRVVENKYSVPVPGTNNTAVSAASNGEKARGNARIYGKSGRSLAYSQLSMTC